MAARHPSGILTKAFGKKPPPFLPESICKLPPSGFFSRQKAQTLALFAEKIYNDRMFVDNSKTRRWARCP
ncbi:hypothetical protein KJ836_03660, partial [Patescibacteria group bacterium]|nr:hypothetical protein [Patescibacteria group bacterium]